MAQETTGKNLSKLIAGYESCGKKAAIAATLGESESQLSKLIHIHGPKLCRLMDLMEMEINKSGYVQALETILHEKTK